MFLDQLISGPPPVLAPPILLQATSTNAFHAASFITEERNPGSAPSNLAWMMPNSSLKRSPSSISSPALQTSSPSALGQVSSFDHLGPWISGPPAVLAPPTPILAPPILKQSIPSQLPLQEASTNAFHAAPFITEERNPGNSPSKLDWMMPNSSLKRSPFMRKKHPAVLAQMSVPATSRNAFQADSFIPEKKTLDIRKPANLSSKVERMMPHSSQKRSPSTSPPRKRRKSRSTSPEKRQMTPALTRPPPPPTCEKKASGDPEEIKDAKVQKEPSSPTIYSRLKNVVTGAIQKMWSIFQ